MSAPLSTGTLPAGLVGQETSRTPFLQITHPTLNKSHVFGEMNQRRRLRRMRRVVIAAADQQRAELEAHGGRAEALLVTLTYAKAGMWDAKDISGYLEATRKWLRRRGIPVRYQWVMELTRAGRPHYHVLWWVPWGTRLPMPDKSGYWSKGLSRIERAKRPVDYLIKYATKGTCDELPKGGRLFGCGSDSPEVRRITHIYGLPTWLAERAGYQGRWRRIAHVGWVNIESGEVQQSPFSVRITRNEWGMVVLVISERLDE